MYFYIYIYIYIYIFFFVFYNDCDYEVEVEVEVDVDSNYCEFLLVCKFDSGEGETILFSTNLKNLLPYFFGLTADIFLYYNKKELI